MTTTIVPTPGCPRFPVSAGLLALFLYVVSTPLLLPAQDPFAENNPDNPAPARQSTLLSDRPEAETNPTVLSILDTNPQTPLEITRTAQQLIDLDRPALAVTLLERVAAVGASDDELARLVTELGSAFFLRIQRDPDLQPTGAAVAMLVQEAAKKQLLDEGRINAFIDQLLGDDAAGRTLALDSLRQHGEPAAIALAMRLQDDSRDDLEVRRIVQALVELGPSADAPLVGMLGSSNEVFRARLFDVLAQRRSMRALVLMVAPAIALPAESILGNAARAGLQRVLGDVPTQRDAELFLYKQLDRYLAMDLMIPHGPDGKITLWQWVEPDQVIRVKHSPTVARLVLAAQAATDLYAVNQENEQYQLLYLRSILEASKVLNGMDQPLAGLGDDKQGPPTAGSIALQADANTLLAVYHNAIQTDHLPAAVGALEVLAFIDDPRLFNSSSGRPSLLVEAVRHPDRRLRFAAVQTIVKKDPRQPYPGSSFVLETLAYFAGSYGKPRVLTGDGIVIRSQSWAGMLGNLGFAGDRASSGKDLFRMAASNPDYEFILIGDTIYHPGVAETVSLLRKDPRTADIPIGIVTDVNERGVGRRIVAQDDRAHLLINPQNTESMIIQTRALLEMAGEQPVTIAERVAQAQFALDAMSQFAGNPEEYSHYDVSRHQQMLIAALFQPQLGRHAAPALGGIATPDATRALLNFASQETEVLKSRGIAVVALDQAFQKRGLLLEKQEIQQVYSLYNASLNLKDDEVVDLLGAILNVIEGPFWRAEAEKDNREADRRAEQRSTIVELQARGYQLTLGQKRELLRLLETDFGGQRSSVTGLATAISRDEEKVIEFKDHIEALKVGVTLDSHLEQVFLQQRERVLEKNKATMAMLADAEKEHGDKMYSKAAQLRAAIVEEEK